MLCSLRDEDPSRETLVVLSERDGEVEGGRGGGGEGGKERRRGGECRREGGGKEDGGRGLRRWRRRPKTLFLSGYCLSPLAFIITLFPLP